MAELKLIEYNDEITKLYETLMSLEMQLVDQLEVRRCTFWGEDVP